jgi:hypothetical protein
MILFLDFDGVLHPLMRHEPDFCRLPLFWKILRACPDASVVLSTSWREIYRPEEIIEFATYGGGEDLTHRFIGSNPSVVREPGAYIAGRVYKREEQCLEWLRANGGKQQPWLALDDMAFWFRGDNLYLVNAQTGLTDADVAAIIQRINEVKNV